MKRTLLEKVLDYTVYFRLRGNQLNTVFMIIQSLEKRSA